MKCSIMLTDVFFIKKKNVYSQVLVFKHFFSFLKFYECCIMFTEFHKIFPARFRDWFFEIDRDNLFILTFDKSAENIKAWIQSIAPYFKNVKTGAFETFDLLLCVGCFDV